VEIYIKERRNNMAYAQRFGLSRNSPLLKEGPSKSDLKWGYKGDNGWVDGTEYSDPKSEYNTEGAGKDNMIGSFTDEELNSAKKSVDLKTKIDQVKGGDTWENSKFNTQPKKGFNENGEPVKYSSGDQVFLGDKNITEEHNKKFNKAGGSKQTVENTLDNTQSLLGVGGFTPGYGFFSDAANSAISAGRGFGAMLGYGDKSAGEHFKEAGKSAFYSVPGYGDVAALSKFTKGSKMINNYNKGNHLRKMVTSTGKYAQPILQSESKIGNLLRGASSFAIGKNKNNKIGSAVKTVLGGGSIGGTVSAGLSSKGIIKGSGALDTLNSAGTGLADASVKTFGGDDFNAFAQGGTKPMKMNKFKTPKKQEVADEKNKDNPASSIIADNNIKASGITKNVTAP
tara:strand:+ start:14 stop:1204 length:1191 start_codon:yes stop_codon:yes gene_type:complete